MTDRVTRRLHSMWTCPDCGRHFANHGQIHSCKPPGDLDHHFDGVDQTVKTTFESFVSAVRDIGSVEIIPQATRIAFQTRMSFAALMPRKHWLNGHLVLARRTPDARFHRITSYSTHNHVHEFRLTKPTDIDDRMKRHLAAAYEVGLQKHHSNDH